MRNNKSVKNVPIRSSKMHENDDETKVTLVAHDCVCVLLVALHKEWGMKSFGSKVGKY